jgi:hypothetical protein
MTLSDAALLYGSRGWFVFPCKGKRPLTAHGFKDATVIADQLREWWTKWPDANIAIACGASGIAVLDIDKGLPDMAAALAWCERNGIPRTYAVRTGRRPEVGLQVYFRGTVPDVGLFELDGCSGQVKSLGGYVMAAGSIHPDTKEKYEALHGDCELAELPENIRALQTKRAQVNVSGVTEKIPEGAGRHAALFSILGKLRASGLDEAGLLAAIIPINDSICEVPLPYADLQDMARNASRFAVPEPVGEVTIAAPVVEADTSEDADDEKKTPHPKYPDHVWQGTAYGDFADLCARDNAIPKRFFSEAFRTVVGSLMGGKVRADVQGGIPRIYTVLIAPPGKGKGTACSLVQDFFGLPWRSTDTDLPPLLFKGKSPYRQDGIGAWILNFSSAPGLMHSLEPDKPEKGNKTVDIQATWNGVPRLITINEELKTLFANFSIETTGDGLEACLCELYDRESFSSTSTAKRRQMAGEAQYSLLGGMTPDGWDKVFAASASVESGFLSRLNIVATEGRFPVSAGLAPIDFTRLRQSFIPRILELKDREHFLRITPEAHKAMSVWFSSLPTDDDKAFLRTRINVHAWRSALHLAWLRRSDYITDEHVRAGIELADYQMLMREFYAPTPGDTRQAKCEAAIRKVMQAKRRRTIRELQRATNANRVGISQWKKCLDALVTGGEVRLDGKVCILLKQKD